MDTSKKLIVILGPTASGKTSLAIEAAHHFETEILSADSRQFYSDLNIGVARPSNKELASAIHHFIAFKSIHEDYSAGQFETHALRKAADIFAKSNYAICAGGSTLYLQAFLSGLDDLPSDKSVKSTLQQEIDQNGISALAEKLKDIDPEYYDQVDIKNPHRVIRALEVFSITGKKYSSLRKAETQTRPFKVIKFGIDLDRTVLYDRINRRVDQMIADGLVEEVKSLIKYSHVNALQTVGYSELFDHFNGKMTLEQAIDKIKQHTRNYAKRQMTWWRRDMEIHWLKDSDSGQVKRMVDVVTNY